MGQGRGRKYPRLGAESCTLLREMGLAFVSRGTTEAKTNDTAKWIKDHIKIPPPREKRMREKLRREWKALAGRYF